MLFSFWVIILLFTPLTAPKNENFKTMKKSLEVSSFYISVPKIMIRCYTVPAFWCVWDEIIFYLRQFLCPFTPLTAPKNEHFIKMKKAQEISSFNTSIPKIMIRCYTVPEIWHVPDVVVIFHFGQFLALLRS